MISTKEGQHDGVRAAGQNLTTLYAKIWTLFANFSTLCASFSTQHAKSQP
jgi:hypothetical protein